MNPLKDLQEYIDRYRLGEISETDFQQRLESDAELKQEFELHQKDVQIIRSSAKEELRERAATALEKHENFEEKSVSIFSLKRVMQIAAVFIFLVGAFFLIQNIGQPKSSADLFAAHFELPAPAAERNANAPTEIWNQAMTAYAEQDFAKTIELLVPVVELEDFPFPNQGNLYLGLSQLMENESQKAITYFDAVSKESSYGQNAEWFRALIFLKMNNLEEAKKALQNIADQARHFKQQEATLILEDL